MNNINKSNSFTNIVLFIFHRSFFQFPVDETDFSKKRRKEKEMLTIKVVVYVSVT